MTYVADQILCSGICNASDLCPIGGGGGVIDESLGIGEPLV